MFLRTTLLTTNLIKNSMLLNNEVLKVNQLLILGGERKGPMKIAGEDKKTMAVNVRNLFFNLSAINSFCLWMSFFH